MQAIDLDETRKELTKELKGYKVTDEDLNSYLMYPKVFLDYMGRRRTYGPVTALPTAVFFYGMNVAEEISVDIGDGKTLEIRLLAVGESNEEGDVKVFFELNGQPRTIRVPDRSIQNLVARREKADPNNKKHVGSPMPGHIGKLSVKDGDKVKVGDVLLTIEAMKMETSIHSDQEGTVKNIHVDSGTSVDAKDLLIEFE